MTDCGWEYTNRSGWSEEERALEKIQYNETIKAVFFPPCVCVCVCRLYVVPGGNIITGAQQADCCLQAICGYYASIKGNLLGDTHTKSNTL